jgi:hypothetical protein
MAGLLHLPGDDRKRAAILRPPRYCDREERGEERTKDDVA